MSKQIRKFGWIPDAPDYRDFFYAQKVIAVPDKVDLSISRFMPAVYDQGSLGSCVFNAIGGAFEFLLPLENKPVFMPSRLFSYYIYREKNNCLNEDSGATIRDALKVYVKKGVCPESMWEYDTSKFTTRPSKACYTEAMDHQVLKYNRLRRLSDMEQCIAEGYPFVAGIRIYESFQSKIVAETGIVPYPNIINENFLGGHAVLFVGYDQALKLFKVRNSWGSGWGDKGYFYLPYEFVGDSNLASDFWTIKLTE